MDDLSIEDKIANLLIDGVIFCNNIPYEGTYVTVLYVDASGIFGWGIPDIVNFDTSEVDKLYEYHTSDPDWGNVKWICIKKDMQPMRIIKQQMIKDGSWNSEMDYLQINTH
jgi:hypothetical protein